MARNQPISSLIDQVRAEAGHSLNPAQGRQMRDTILAVLQRQQEVLWEDFDWPHLKVFRYIPLMAGQRFYSPPPDMVMERIVKIEVYFGNQLTPLGEEITEADIDAFNSDLGIRAWPVRKWRVAENDMVEVWPVPSQNADTAMLGSAPAYQLQTAASPPQGTLEGVLRVTGIRNLRPFVADSDLCDLDGRLLVLSTAAELLARDNAPEAKKKDQEAAIYYQRLKGRSIKGDTFVLGGGSRRKGYHPPGPPLVAYRTSGS